MEDNKKIQFYGGRWISFLPFLVFLLVAIYISILQAPDVKGMWIGALFGIMITFLLAKDRMYYAQVVIEGMADKTAIVPIACWIFAGVFSAVLKDSGLVNGIIWLAYNLGASGTVFTVVTFLASALFATAAGTGFGTIMAGMAVLYPAGVLLGCNPAVLAGAIVSGGIFGDNLAPVSDTTICSATTQGADVGGVVKSRLKYALAAAAIAIVIFIIFGGKGGTVSEVPYDMIAQYMNPVGLVMLIPAGITIYVAIKKGDIIVAATIGTILSIIFALVCGLTTFERLFFVEDGAVGGVLVNGITGMVDICILALLILSCVHIMKVGEGDKKLLQLAEKFVHSVRGVEVSIAALAISLSAIMGLNAPPILAIGSSFAKPLGEKYNIHPYRRANLLDATACTLVYSLPWTPALLMTQSLAQQANADFGSLVPALTTTQIVPWVVHAWALLAVMIFAIITGWGRQEIKNSDSQVG